MKIDITSSRSRVANSAFTLVESLVGMSVLSIVVFSLNAGLGLGFTLIQTARENLRATQILTEKMEVARLCQFDKLITPGYLPASFTASYYEGSSTTNGTLFSGTLTVSPASGSVNYSNDLRKVTVAVSWHTQGIQRSRQLSTLTSRYGIQNYVYN